MENGSSLGKGDEHIFMITDRTGSPNVVVRDLFNGQERVLTANDKGILKSYVYFDGTFNQGLGKASICLDCEREMIYYIQDDRICRMERTMNVYCVSSRTPQRMDENPSFS